MKDVLNAETPEPSQRGPLDLTSNEWMQKAGELEAEVERLRAEKEHGYWDAKNLKAEVERLREDQEKADAVIVYQHNEVERLREENEYHIETIDYLRRIEEAARAMFDPAMDEMRTMFAAKAEALRAALEQK